MVDGATLAGPLWLTVGALGIAGAGSVGLHVWSAGRLDPVTTTISDYASLPGGAALLGAVTLATATATGAVPVVLVRAELPDPVPVCVLFGASCLGLLTSVVFPTNAPGTAASLSAVLHRWGVGAFLVGLPTAARAARRRMGGPGGVLGRLLGASITVGAVFLISHLPRVAPGLPLGGVISVLAPRGLSERVLLAVDLALLAAAAAAGVLRARGRA